MRQAAAAIGQGRLMAVYGEAFGRRDRLVGQVLLTRQLAQDRPRYVNAQNTLQALLRHDVVPIVNENDTVAIEELQFGDNDTLAALVAALVKADLLILLTNVAGLLDEQGELIPEVPEITDTIRALAGGAGEHGSGGMATKVGAAEIAGAAGIPTVVTCGRDPEALLRAAEESCPGTRFVPTPTRLRGRKHWLAFGTQPQGSLTVNSAARHALVEQYRSLLPAGVTRVQGSFQSGETVSLLAEDGREFGRGLVNCDARDARALMGVRTWETEKVLGRRGVVELIHRDNLAILPGSQRPEREGSDMRPLPPRRRVRP
ncbi:MAG: glutamate 5-kinase [Armatimonadetes bacterium]|nr:glutamate 5-kinase [Armatimonadota bacterium]